MQKTIAILKTKNSFGHDGISTKLLKEISIELIKPLTTLTNHCFHTGIFPDNLKIAKVISLHKKDDPTDINNYRPISLLPSISKVLEKIVLDQIKSYFTSHNLLYNNQYGFRSHHSTELATMHLMDRIITSMDEGLVPLNIFLDLSKAFDTLDHTILLGKLNYYGISNTELLFFENYLFLFLIYINDFPAATAYFDFIIYADDTTVMTNLHINEFDNIDVLTQTINTELVHINEWLKVNKLSLTAAKSKYMMFHMPQRKI